MFNNIIGNKKNKEILKQIVQTGNVSHCYMFIGQEGIGKLMFAKEFAKALLCEQENKPCGVCNSCIKFENGNNPDINIINEEENVVKIELIRNLVKDVLEKPIQSNKKIYIINNSENMTKEAQNCLLKTLEEPPEYVIIILITKSNHLLLNTINSRCTKIKFNDLKNEEIARILQEKFNYENVPESLLKISSGSIGKALREKDSENIYEALEKVLTELKGINIIDLFKIKETIFKDKENIYEILDYMNIIFNNIIIENIANSTEYLQCNIIIEETKDRLKKNSNYDMTIDNLLFNIWEAVNNG